MTNNVLQFPKREKQEDKEQPDLVQQCLECHCQTWYITLDGYECSGCGLKMDMEGNKQ